MNLLFIFLIGLAVGSFVNCLVYRLHLRGVSPPEAGPLQLGGVLKERSFCDHCRRKLSWWENIPVLSWLLLRGRCRTCRSPIPYQYPLVELLTGVLFWGVWGVWGTWGELIFWGVMTVGLMIIFASDWLYGMIPDVVILPASLLAVIFRTNYLISGLGAFLFFYLIVCLTRGKGMGMGDVKLAFLMGVLLGWPKIFVALWLAFVIGAVAAGFLLILKKKRLSDTMALGPFLILGLYLALFFGERLWKLFLPI